MDIILGIMSVESIGRKTCKNFLQRVMIPVFIIFFMVISGCTGTERIGMEQAVQIALNDSKTLSIINNDSYNITDVSVAHLSIGTGGPVELYSVTIDVLNGTDRRAIAFISFDGKVIQVDNSFPPPKPPAYLLNESMTVTVPPHISSSETPR
jgi:hypothetical protein